MTGPYGWTLEETAQARVLRAEGMSYAKIAAALRVTASQVYWHLVKRDLPRPRKLRLSPWRQNPALHDMMCALLDEGHSRREVGRRIGMTKNAIIGRCYRAGLCEERDTGPTTMEQLDALNRGMDDLFQWQNMIFGSHRLGHRAPPQKKSTERHLGASLSGGFGSRALGHGQNGFRAARAPTGAFR